MVKLYKCAHCGNIVEMVEDKGVNVVCCGQKMDLLEPNTTDAAGEKHVPVAEADGNKVVVKVGSVEHPMTEEHHISFIILETDKGVQRKNLDPVGKPEAEFVLADGEKAVAAYEYCNLHGFWKAEL
ncbi:MAG: desulfoferrodoxin family protein [Emergencia sp.]|nr:desulfoferrodoxin family protein [Emergencia sp.]